MKEIIITDAIKEKCPDLHVLQIECNVKNPPTSDILWAEIEDASAKISATFQTDQIKNRSAIKATRAAYKTLGKDPNRYRPSAEALCRRILNGKGLYRLTTLVDLINLISLRTGHSIGGFDALKIDGEHLWLGIGTEEDKFYGIGRGQLNIANLPVYRDLAGGIGTPTSDEERTKLTDTTNHLLMLVNIYGKGHEESQESMEAMICDLLKRHAAATDIRMRRIYV